MISAPWYDSPSETLAFNMFACHYSALDGVVDDIVAEYHRTGNASITVNTPFVVNAEDLAYIQHEVERRLK